MFRNRSESLWYWIIMPLSAGLRPLPLTKYVVRQSYLKGENGTTEVISPEK